MKKIGLFKGLILCSQYEKMSEENKTKARDLRLRELVRYAKANSPYYQELYKNIGDDFALSDLPPVNKVDLMARFDDWITDQTVRLKDIQEFMRDLDNIGRKFHGIYLIFTTSGSTGNPLVALSDKTSGNMFAAINARRSFARKQDLKAYVLKGAKSIGVFATGGFYLGNSSIRARLLAMPWKKKQMAVTSALKPIPEIVRELNAFQPAMLGGYPTILELLIDEQEKGRLNIHPVLIMTGGEYLSEDVRNRLSRAFGCYVQTSYSCTEGGSMAHECTEHHFHVNDDWILVEPVDKENRPVTDGVQSDKILITNLYNYTQPFIRYEVTDRVVMHHEKCPCGKASPWLTLEGRTDDVVSFLSSGKEIKIAPLAIYAALKEVHEIVRFQLAVYKGNRTELRLVPAEGIGKKKAFEIARDALKALLSLHGVTDVSVTLSEEEPKQHPGSGKFKHILNIAE
jgi:phenylacetate-coenzyme A ligase PaaK-like adenylate-forming protein